ncbi:MAG: hypothetical protein HQK79_14080 [Desulfobacterales bacterium]|nr:hypothetical protein [Desulfobacterales bacterium]MBF0396706.1 hypothetical protein [Desulfobacterales bacterium]
MIDFKSIKLSKRDMLAIYFGVGSLILFILFQFIIYPLIDKEKRLLKDINAKTKILEEVQKLKSEYDVILKKEELLKERFSKRKQGFTLFSFVDSLAGVTGIKDNISYMKPSSTTPKDSQYKISSVEMKIQSLTMDQLTNYLYKIEASDNMVTVKRISISQNSKDENFIDAILQIETIEV